MALHGALSVPIEGVRPSDVRQFLKRVYAVRSQLAHGSHVGKTYRLDGSKGNLNQMQSDLERFVSTALTRFLEAIAIGPSFNVSAHVDSWLDSHPREPCRETP